MPWPNEFLDLLPTKLRKDYWFITVKRRPRLKYTILALLLLFLGSGYYYIFLYTGDLLDDNGKPLNFEKLARSDFKRASYIYDSNGETIGRIFEELRDPIQINEVPKLLQNGFITAEDKRFNPNRPKRLVLDYICDRLYIGIDPCAITRAGLGILMRANNLSGASGLRQQLARLLYADEVSDFKTRNRTIGRKIKEAKVAIQISRRYSNDEVVEGILNMIYFGHGVNGIAEAVYRYFGKDIRKDKLSLREIAILVSLNKSPSLYCPIFHKPSLNSDISKEKYDTEIAKETVRLVKARERYNWVLGRMLEDGYISKNDFDKESFKKEESLDSEFAKLHPIRNPDFGYSNRMVKEFFLSEGHTDRELAYYGGLRIYTTINSQIQKIATEEFEKHLELINEDQAKDKRIEGAFIVIEVKTGNIIALSGGSDFNQTQYNRVLASRSPGSGFKPFTYAAAIEKNNLDYFDKICNCPFSMRGSRPGNTWSPKNFREDNPVSYGYINLSTGLVRSVNLATLNLARSIGVESVIEIAHRMGVWGNPGIVRDSDGEIWLRRPGYQINSGLVPLLPTVIGASDVNLLELANAYTVFYRNGLYMRPNLIQEVRDSNGELVAKQEISKEKRVISEKTALKSLAMMRAVTKVGTAKISMRNINQQVACKTGTSDGPRDTSIWCGSPELILAIRFGNDNYSIIDVPTYMRKISGQPNMQVSGGWLAGPLARKIIDRIYSELRPIINFSPEVEIEHERLLTGYRD